MRPLALLAAIAAACAPLAAGAQDPSPPAPPGLQFLYGSGEAGALSRQTYRTLTDFALERAARRPEHGVILAEDATLVSPSYATCAGKPLAVVFDVDETVSLNTGLLHGRATGRQPQPGETLPVRPSPGAIEAIRALEAAGITAIYNTNRTNDMAALVSDTIAGFGLTRPIPGDTLFLNGFDSLGANKDGRRNHIAARWCVLAMAGDQLGDFSALFDRVAPVAARRRAASEGLLADNWGHGWFLLPNTAYGNALAGTVAEVFPELEAGANEN